MQPTAKLLEHVNHTDISIHERQGVPVLATPAAFGAGVVLGAKVSAGGIAVAGGGAALCTATVLGCGN